MNSAYTFNLYIKGTVSGSLKWLLYTGLTVYNSKIKGKKQTKYHTVRTVTNPIQKS